MWRTRMNFPHNYGCRFLICRNFLPKAAWKILIFSSKVVLPQNYCIRFYFMSRTGLIELHKWTGIWTEHCPVHAHQSIHSLCCIYGFSTKIITMSQGPSILFQYSHGRPLTGLEVMKCLTCRHKPVIILISVLCKTCRPDFYKYSCC